MSRFGVAFASVICLLFAGRVGLAQSVEWPIADGGNGHFYEAVAVPSRINWADAQAAAEVEGGYLATITSAEEQAFVYSLALANPGVWGGPYSLGPWLGGLQPPGSPEPGGGWEWVSGEPWVYTHWKGGEPNNSGGSEDRLHFYSVSSGGWNDADGDSWLFWGYVMECPYVCGLPTVISHDPAGFVRDPVSYVDVTFNEEIDAGTFTIDDIEMMGPDGPISVGPPEDQGGNVWQIAFPEQSTNGEFHILIGPHIADLDGNEMDQDQDGDGGEEADDIYDAAFTIVSVQELTLGEPISDGFAETAEMRFYSVSIGVGQDLGIQLDDLDDDGLNELYSSFERIPTRSEFEYRGTTQPVADQVLRIPGTLAGTYYILAYASDVPEPGPSEFTILADYLPLSITTVIPDQGWNADTDPPISTIYGSGFNLDATVLLDREGQEDILATDVTWLDPSRLFARFNVQGAEPGVWDLTVTNPNETSASYPFNVLSGDPPRLETNLILPSALGYHIPATLYIEYANTGGASMPAPLLRMHATLNALLTADESMAGPGLWTDTPPPGLSDTVQVIALGTGPDPTVLAPGESAVIPIYYRGCRQPWDFSYPPFEFTLGVLYSEDATPIGWPALKDDMRPESMPTDAWDAIWMNLTTQIGNTWGGYVATLAGNAAYLRGLGRDVVGVRSLLAFEIAQASALSPHRSLAGSVDAHAPAPGIPLVFSRAYGQTIDSRYELGPLGRGWDHNWNVYAEELPDGIVLIHGPNGVDRYFADDGSGGYTAPPGEYGVLTKSSGKYRLTEKDGFAWQFQTDNRLEFVEDTNGNSITLIYTAGLLTNLNHSNGDSLTLGYNPDDRINQLTDTVGRTTSFVYDGEYLSTVTAPGSRTITYSYETAGTLPQRHALLSVRYPDMRREFFVYDALGRLTQTHRDDGEDPDDILEPVSYSYDPAGTVTVEDATGRHIVLFFGNNGQLLKAVDGEGNPLHLEYDLKHQLATLTGPDSQHYGYSYDPRGNMVGIRDPLDNPTSLTYTSASQHNRLGSVTDARGNKILYSYDSASNLTSITYEDGTCESFTYDDANGNILTWTNRRDNAEHPGPTCDAPVYFSVVYGYNSRGQVTTKDYSATPAVPDSEYVYISAGNLTSATNAASVITMDYAPNTDWLTRIDYPGGKYFEFEYDDAGRRTKRTDQDGYEVRYGYDDLGRLDTLSDETEALIVDYDYDGAGRLERKTLGNGVYTTYMYDGAGRLTDLVNSRPDDPDDELISSFVYTYDASGRRTSMTRSNGDGAFPYLYGYDDLGQLTTVTYPDMHVATYVYDAAGNRMEVDDGTVVPYTTNDMNQYTDVGDVTYTYDDDGNMETETAGGVTTTYTYDIENRLVGVATLSETWVYTYDALGNRIASSWNGVLTNYVVDLVGYGDVAAEYDDLNQLIARYDHGHGLLARIVGTDSTYYTFDGIGSTSELTSTAGAAVNSYTWDPFGMPLSKSETMDNCFEYVGEYGVMDEDSPLDFMRARFYSAGLGRFLTPDPVGLHGGVNLYRYARNNPVLFVDPSGLFLKDFVDFLLNLVDAAMDQAAWPIGTLNSARRFAEDAHIGDPVGMGVGGLRELMGLGFEQRERDVYRDLGMPYPGGSLPTAPIPKWPDGLPPQPELAPPDPPTQPIGEGSSQNPGSTDPNDKIGPTGHGEGGCDDCLEGGECICHVPSGEAMPYIVYFENEPDATAAARDVHVTDQLDADLDWNTFEFGEIAFGAYHVPVPPGLTHFETSMAVDGWTWNEADDWHTGETPLICDIEADFNVGTGAIAWSIGCYDPNTGFPPTDPYAGFLPPDDEEDITGRGEGHCSYLVRPLAGLPTGTQITNMASIVFDLNPPIETPVTLHVIDAEAPSSSVTELPPTTDTFPFTVEWTGQDDEGGSGIATYDLFVAMDGGAFGLWLSTPETSAILNGQTGHTYAFYTVATDHVGHREDAPAEPDATTTIVVPNLSPICAIDAPTSVECQGETTAIELDGTGSVDPKGSEIFYLWSTDCPGGTFDDPTSGTPILTIDTDCTVPITCDVTLIVTDEDDATDTCFVTVAIVDPCPADFDGDGDVDAADLAELLGSWGPCPGCPQDMDGDDAVGAFDLALVLGAWGPCE